VVIGIRPEHFEDASLVQDKGSGATLRAKVEVLESMGSELYAYFTVDSQAVEAEELREIAEDAGTADVPGTESGQIVARLDASSKARQGEEMELWVDTSKIHFFDASDGRRLTGASAVSASPA
jgi:multiple sugar transport system ATP-binding protein